MKKKPIKELNRVDALRSEFKAIAHNKYKLYYLMVNERLCLMNPLMTDKEKIEYVEEINTVFEEYVMELFEEKER